MRHGKHAARGGLGTRRAAANSSDGLVALLRRDGWAGLFVAYVFSRMSAGTVGFVFLLVGQRVEHSLQQGALADAGFLLALALTQPAFARAADRRGVRSVLRFTATLYSSALVATAVLASHGPVWLIVGATLCGAVMPPLGATFRATLTATLSDPAVRSKALTLEAMILEGVQLAGPLIVTGCVALFAPQLTLVWFAGSVLVGTLLLSADSRLRAKPVQRSGAKLLSAPMVRILLAWMVFTGTLSALEVIAVAFSGPSRVWLSGLSVAVLAGGSIVGGLVTNARPLPGRPASQLPVLLGFMTVGSTALYLASSPAALVVTVGLLALAVAPTVGIIMTLLGDVVPPDRRSEAFAWLGSANGLGGALWTAGAGALAAHGIGWAVTLCAGSLLAGSLLALRVGPPLRTIVVLSDSQPERVLAPVGS